MDFSLYPLRFSFVALDPIPIPAGGAGNVFRGALGSALPPSEYSELFRSPRTPVSGPSGLVDRPRCFVVRAAHLDDARLAPGDPFFCDIHLFDTGPQALTTIDHFATAFRKVAADGLGPRRGRAELLGVPEPKLLTLDLSPEQDALRRIVVEFLTPTELKTGGGVTDRPEFGVLFARVRDRIATLRLLYGAGPLDLDFKAMAQRATALVSLERCDLRHIEIARRSSRTRQIHSLGGFVGEAEYAGDLGEFLPWLRAAQWTGVGRQTVWGKGVIAVS